jgi:methylthioribose-1-phosphate isomerase
MINAVEWCGDYFRFIDQTKLPSEESYVQTDDVATIADAIRKLKIRGAPLIGITAAYAVALSAVRSREVDFQKYTDNLTHTIIDLRATRPTAVNLFWALQRMQSVIALCSSIGELKEKLVDEAKKIHEEDREMCRKIGINGAQILPSSPTILTHCNTGALATGGSGTAQSIITTAYDQGKKVRVYADETRPLLQGARLTVWELMKYGIEITLITDSMAAFLMQQNKINAVIVGADRICTNGDVVNKIGTYNLAVLAKHHGVPFYAAAPISTVDTHIHSADDVVIEERSAEEVRTFNNCRTSPVDVKVYNPAFDRTPSSLVTAIITDRGVHKSPFDFSSSV